MKKLIALLLVSLFTLCPAAMAEEIDLTAMSTAELQELHALLDAELVSRNAGAHPVITEGMYTAGISIKPGVYKITCAETYSEEGMVVNTFANEDDFASYSIGTGYGMGDAYNNLMKAYLAYSKTIESGQTITVQLTEGMVLHLNGGICEIHAVNADWAM